MPLSTAKPAPRLQAFAAALLALALTAPAVAAAELPTGRFEIRTAAARFCGSPFGCEPGIAWGWIELSRVAAGPGGEPVPRVDRLVVRFSSPLVSPIDTTKATVRPGDEAGHWELRQERVFDFDLLVASADDDRMILSGVRSSVCFDGNCGASLGSTLLERSDSDAPLRLLGGRFTVEVDWRVRTDTGPGHPEALGNRAGRFWFFRPENPELLIKMVPACGPFGHNWFFATGLTDVGVTIRVTDTTTGVERLYEDPEGQVFEPIQDTAGFPCE